MTAGGTAARTARIRAAAQLVGGATLIARAHAVSRRTAGSGTPAPVWLVRALGARLAVQAGIEFGCPNRRVLLAGALIDATHGASMLAAAQMWPRYRRPAMLSAGAAFGSAALAAVLSAALDDGSRS